MGFSRYAAHTFYFDYDLEREDESLIVRVAYTVEDDAIYLEAVRHKGRDIDTTTEEDDAMLGCARERAGDDMVDAESDYGDYLYEMRRDAED
jgi:hypothetical protein